MKTIRIGTRKSELALWQANFVREKLLSIHADIDVRLVEIVSQGDKTLDIPLAQVGGKGLFLKELELALVEDDIDIAVHSMKDVTVALPQGLHIPVVCERGNPRDVLVSNHFSSLAAMPPDTVIGTCSLRRRCQVAAAYPQLQLQNLRGNVNSRLAKLDNGQFGGIILAAAGLERLAMVDRITEILDPEICLPAVGQGIIGIECRIRDKRINDLIRPLDDYIAAIEIRAERAANACLGGGCHVPVGLFSQLSGNELTMRGLVGQPDGSRIIRSEHVGSGDDPEGLGQAVAQDLISQGAGEILESVYARD